MPQNSKTHLYITSHNPPAIPQDLPAPRRGSPSGDDVMTPLPLHSSEHDEDLAEYKFQKYAATYFQGNVNHHYSRKQLKQPLLNLQTQGDQLVSLPGSIEH